MNRSYPELTVEPPIDRTESTVVRWGTIIGKYDLENLLREGKRLKLNLEGVSETNSPQGDYVVTFSLVIPGVAHPRDGEI